LIYKNGFVELWLLITSMNSINDSLHSLYELFTAGIVEDLSYGIYMGYIHLTSLEIWNLMECKAFH
jgi:hypothetical protein